MQELDHWSEANIVAPLVDRDSDPSEDFEEVIERVKKAIRTKVLESYRNGQAAGPRTVKRPQRGGR